MRAVAEGQVTVEVTLEPGQGSMPHRHPGPVFGYILEGDYEWAIDDQPAKKLKAGATCDPECCECCKAHFEAIAALAECGCECCQG